MILFILGKDKYAPFTSLYMYMHIILIGGNNIILHATNLTPSDMNYSTVTFCNKYTISTGNILFIFNVKRDVNS
jgi:hypothetical protein